MHGHLFIVSGADLEYTKKYFMVFMVNDAVLEYTYILKRTDVQDRVKK